MKTKITILFSLLINGALFAAPMPLGLDSSYPERIEINNRILLKVNGKPVSVMDVTRKMDLLFYRQYPELAASEIARFQFYQMSWRPILAAVIDDQLIAADAEEKKIQVTDGEVREEMDKLFGSNAVLKIDQLGMTYQESWELLKTELLVQRMTSMMVRPKALAEVSPKIVKELYEKMIQENPPQDKWVYHVISVRSDNEETTHSVAKDAYQLLSEEKTPLELLSSHFVDDGVQIAASEEYVRQEGELSSAHKSILSALTDGSYSEPILRDGVSRIFFLKEHQMGKVPPFSEMEEKLKQQLTQEAYTKHSNAYREKLRKYYGFSEEYLSQMLPQELVPFALR